MRRNGKRNSQRILTALLCWALCSANIISADMIVWASEPQQQEMAASGGSSNDTGFIPQTYVGPNGTFVANTEEEMWDAAAKAMGAEVVTIEGNGETGGGSLAGLGVGVEVNSQ